MASVARRTGHHDRAHRERSPVHNADHITHPVLVIQGLDDLVAPEQAIVAALRQRSVPVTELFFPNGGHGVRRAENIIHVLEAELTFYCAVLRGGALG